MPNESVTPNTPGLIRLARAELEAAKAKHCQHGVPQTACRDHRTDDGKGGYIPKAEDADQEDA